MFYAIFISKYMNYQSIKHHRVELKIVATGLKVGVNLIIRFGLKRRILWPMLFCGLKSNKAGDMIN